MKGIRIPDHGNHGGGDVFEVKGLETLPSKFASSSIANKIVIYYVVPGVILFIAQP